MLDIQDFMELNEAFNSEPYESTHITSDPNRERYTFKEDENHNYRVEVAASNKLGLPPFGTKTRVVRIGFNTSNSSVYRPVITKFKDPKKVISTILGIINNYKTDGLKGSQIQGFAIMIDPQLFGSYGKTFKRIARMYLRQQFNVSESDYTPVEDNHFVWIARKGKNFADVFNGSGITQDVGQANVAQAEQPANEPAPAPQEPTATSQQTMRFNVGDYISTSRGDGDTYYDITGITFRDDVAYYELDQYTVRSPDVQAQTRIKVSIADANFELHDFSGTPEEADAPKYNVGDKLNDALVDDLYLQITRLSEVDGVWYYYVDKRYKNNDLAYGSDVYKVSFVDDSPRFSAYVPETNTPASRFDVGDYVKSGNPGTNAYYVIQGIVYIGGQPHYETTAYRIADGNVIGDGRFPVATADETWVEFDPTDPAENNAVGATKFNVGDTIVNAVSMIATEYAKIFNIADHQGVLRYEYDMYRISDNQNTGRGNSAVADVDRENNFVKYVIPQYSIGTLLKKPSVDNRYIRITGIVQSFADTTYKFDVMSVDTDRVVSNMQQKTTALESEGYEPYTVRTQYVYRFEAGDKIAKRESGTYFVVTDIETVEQIDYYVLDRYKKSDNSLDATGAMAAAIGVDAPTSGYELYEPQGTSNSSAATRFRVGDTIARPSSQKYFIITGIDTVAQIEHYVMDRYRKSDNVKDATGAMHSVARIDGDVYELYEPTAVNTEPTTSNITSVEPEELRFAQGQYIAKESSDYYFYVSEVLRDTQYYRVEAYKKATRRRNRSSDGLIRFAVAHSGQYYRYSPTTGAYIGRQEAPATTPSAPSASSSPVLNNPQVVAAVNTSNLRAHTWYTAKLDGSLSFVFVLTPSSDNAQMRSYTFNGDTHRDGQLYWANPNIFTSWSKLDSAPVFNRTPYNHRFNVGQEVTNGYDTYKIDGFRGVFYVVNNNSAIREITDIDANYSLVGAQDAPVDTSTIEGALTKAQHKEAIRQAKAKYGISVSEGNDFIDKMMRECPKVSVLDICVAMFGSSEDPNGGDRKLVWSGRTLTVSQVRGDIHGAPVTQLVRDFKFGEGYVYHNYLAMAPGAQGGGATKKLFTESIPLYENMGLKKVKVYANIQVGAAIWSKYGFKSYLTMDQDSWERYLDGNISSLNYLKRTIGGMDEFDTLHEAEFQGIINLLNGFKSQGYFSDYPAMLSSLTMPNVEGIESFQNAIRARCSGAKAGVKLNIGKMLMWGNGFKGELDLSDRKSYNRMARYVGLPTR